MVETKSMTEEQAEFNKIIDYLANLEVNLEDEDKALHLLCTLPKSYESFKDTMLYGRENPVTLEEVQSALRSKELTKLNNLKVENGMDALNVSSGRGGGGGRGSSEYEGYEYVEALVVSGDDARDGGELGDFGVAVSEELERSCLLQGGDHGGYTLVETQFEVESSNSGRQSTLTLGYLIGDREEGGSVEPKRDDHGDLVGYISIVSEEVQDLERIFREAIESNGDQTLELVELLEVFECKGSLMLQLVEPPKIPRWVRSQAILREDGRHSGGRRVVELVELCQMPMIVANKRFFREVQI
ncbi:unnamed protein product [Trifolium pratense]|uniref:Uncharacterized protein n=1 Tax=Trifolium pratense TaxID=57577 RepID=A0ACB0LEJ1_TRIPR|nr:unnamed protein product [Trifolium pratense]